jgi:tRNA(Ile)-lysidine synthase
MSPSPNTCHEAASAVGSFEAQVAATIDAYRLLHTNDRVLVAVSGGPDSVALLHALLAAQDRYRLTLVVAHLNHGLREAAAAEQAFVADLARRLALPFHTDRRDVRAFRQRQGLSLEDAARQVRYAFLEDTAEAQACPKIAVGHQADDTAELLLMNLLRGSGLLGMSGIAPRQGQVIRPLIDIHRDAIMAYLEEKNQDTCHDESNDDPSLTRNRIRNDLIPHLEAAYNPRLRQALQRTARILRDEETWIETHLDTAWPVSRPSPCRGAPCAEASTGAEGMRLDRPALMAAPVALQRRILRRALAGVSTDLKGLGLRHIEEIRRLADDGERGSRWLDLPRGVRVLVEADQVTLLKESAEARRHRRRDHGDPNKADEVYRIEIACPGENAVTVSLTQIDARLELRTALYIGQPAPDTPWTAYFDLARLTFPLTVRPVQSGDRLRPLGMAGRKKISDLFIDCKIPKPKRHRFPVLVSGGRVIWVAGVRRDHDTRVRAGTQRLLIGEFCLLK